MQCVVLMIHSCFSNYMGCRKIVVKMSNRDVETPAKKRRSMQITSHFGSEPTVHMAKVQTTNPEPQNKSSSRSFESTTSDNTSHQSTSIDDLSLEQLCASDISFDLNETDGN